MSGKMGGDEIAFGDHWFAPNNVVRLKLFPGAPVRVKSGVHCGLRGKVKCPASFGLMTIEVGGRTVAVLEADLEPMEGLEA